MGDILFVTWDGGGNVPRPLAFAGEGRRRPLAPEKIITDTNPAGH
jgi:hypothetical protein